MIKLIGILKRREGMSFEDFKKYYEEHHAVLGRKFLQRAVRYQRRFVRPVEWANDLGNDGADIYDCVTEMWWTDRAAMEADFAGMADPETAAFISADEERLFDRSRIRTYVIEEECPAGIS